MAGFGQFTRAFHDASGPVCEEGSARRRMREDVRRPLFRATPSEIMFFAPHAFGLLLNPRGLARLIFNYLIRQCRRRQCSFSATRFRDEEPFSVSHVGFRGNGSPHCPSFFSFRLHCFSCTDLVKAVCSCHAFSSASKVCFHSPHQASSVIQGQIA